MAEARAAVFAALEDDFNTAAALGALFTFVKATNVDLEAGISLRPTRRPRGHFCERLRATSSVSCRDRCCRNTPGAPEARFSSSDEAGIGAHRRPQEAARRRRDFKAADAIRDELLAAGSSSRTRPRESAGTGRLDSAGPGGFYFALDDVRRAPLARSPHISRRRSRRRTERGPEGARVSQSRHSSPSGTGGGFRFGPDRGKDADRRLRSAPPSNGGGPRGRARRSRRARAVEVRLDALRGGARPRRAPRVLRGKDARRDAPLGLRRGRLPGRRRGGRDPPRRRSRPASTSSTWSSARGENARSAGLASFEGDRLRPRSRRASRRTSPDLVARMARDRRPLRQDRRRRRTTPRTRSASSRLQAAHAGRPSRCFGMGEAGIATRVLAPYLGAPLAFGALVPGGATAPGQLARGGPRRRSTASAAAEGVALFALFGEPRLALPLARAPQRELRGARRWTRSTSRSRCARSGRSSPRSSAGLDAPRPAARGGVRDDPVQGGGRARSPAPRRRPVNTLVPSGAGGRDSGRRTRTADGLRGADPAAAATRRARARPRRRRDGADRRRGPPEEGLRRSLVSRRTRSAARRSRRATGRVVPLRRSARASPSRVLVNATPLGLGADDPLPCDRPGLLRPGLLVVDAPYRAGGTDARPGGARGGLRRRGRLRAPPRAGRRAGGALHGRPVSAGTSSAVSPPGPGLPARDSGVARGGARDEPPSPTRTSPAASRRSSSRRPTAGAAPRRPSSRALVAAGLRGGDPPGPRLRRPVPRA